MPRDGERERPWERSGGEKVLRRFDGGNLRKPYITSLKLSRKCHGSFHCTLTEHWLVCHINAQLCIGYIQAKHSFPLCPCTLSSASTT